jgi:two-component system response regulator (stage 0 sporulation protein A)
MNTTIAGSILETAIKEGKDTNAVPKISREISRILLSIGIPANIMGYEYLREAIILCAKDNKMINNITKALYPTVAINHTTTASKVERAIRHAIETGWSRGRVEEINKMFNATVYGKNERPTNSEFIALITEKLFCDGLCAPYRKAAE